MTWRCSARKARAPAGTGSHAAGRPSSGDTLWAMEKPQARNEPGCGILSGIPMGASGDRAGMQTEAKAVPFRVHDRHVRRLPDAEGSESALAPHRGALLANGRRACFPEPYLPDGASTATKAGKLARNPATHRLGAPIVRLSAHACDLEQLVHAQRQGQQGCRLYLLHIYFHTAFARLGCLEARAEGRGARALHRAGGGAPEEPNRRPARQWAPAECVQGRSLGLPHRPPPCLPYWDETGRSRIDTSVAGTEKRNVCTVRR